MTWHVLGVKACLLGEDGDDEVRGRSVRDNVWDEERDKVCPAGSAHTSSPAFVARLVGYYASSHTFVEAVAAWRDQGRSVIMPRKCQPIFPRGQEI
jgi:hypothetical protein